MNFTYITVKPKDGSFGNVQDDGSWTGIVGDLQNQKVDRRRFAALFPEDADLIQGIGSLRA